MGIAGGCRCDELHKLTVDNIDDQGSILVVTLPDTKTNKPRIFTVISEGMDVNHVDLFRNYARLRPAHAVDKRFFLFYKAGKCSIQPVGIHTLGKIPQEIAKFLNLQNPESFTGHCFRRSSASMLADAGADILTLKRHGGWKSTTVAEGYVEDSISNKVRICEKIMGKSGDGPSKNIVPEKVFQVVPKAGTKGSGESSAPTSSGSEENGSEEVASTSFQHAGASYTFSHMKNCKIQFIYPEKK
jgi:Phage integrase family